MRKSVAEREEPLSFSCARQPYANQKRPSKQAKSTSYDASFLSDRMCASAWETWLSGSQRRLIACRGSTTELPKTWTLPVKWHDILKLSYLLSLDNYCSAQKRAGYYHTSLKSGPANSIFQILSTMKLLLQSPQVLSCKPGYIVLVKYRGQL